MQNVYLVVIPTLLILFDFLFFDVCFLAMTLAASKEGRARVESENRNEGELGLEK